MYGRIAHGQVTRIIDTGTIAVFTRTAPRDRQAVQVHRPLRRNIQYARSTAFARQRDALRQGGPIQPQIAGGRQLACQLDRLTTQGSTERDQCPNAGRIGGSLCKGATQRTVAAIGVFLDYKSDHFNRTDVGNTSIRPGHTALASCARRCGRRINRRAAQQGWHRRRSASVVAQISQ